MTTCNAPVRAAFRVLFVYLEFVQRFYCGRNVSIKAERYCSPCVAVCNCDQICPGLLATLANEVRTSATNNSCSFDRAVVAGNGDLVHVEWIYPHPSGVGRRDDLDTVNTGPSDPLTLRS